MPFLQEGARTIGRALLHTGANIANDVASGKNIRDSLNNQLNQTVSNIVKGRNQSGSGKRQPIKRKAPRQKIIKRQTKKARGSKAERDIYIG